MSLLYRVWRQRSWTLLVLAWLLVAGGRPGYAQAPAWQSAVAFGLNSGSSAAYISATATDASGNVFVAGRFQSTITIGSFTLTSASGGQSGAFVAKWSNSTRSFVWAQQVGSTYVLLGHNGLAVSGNNIYLSGSFGGSNSFGNLTLTTASGDQDIFVAKLVDAGASASWAWVQQFGGSAPDETYGLTTQGSSVYLTGAFFSSQITFGTNTLTRNGERNSFVVKLNDTGSGATVAWAQVLSNASSSGRTEGSCIAVQGSNVYVAGGYLGSAVLGSTILDNPTAYDYYAFVAKLTDAGSSGSVAWAYSAASALPLALALAGTQVYVAGYYVGSTTFFGPTTLPNAGGYDAFVAKLTDAGASANLAWVRGGGGTELDAASALLVQGRKVYVGGTFRSIPATFGSAQASSTGSGNSAFVAQLVDNGTTSDWTWALAAGGGGNEGIESLCLAGTQLYAAGRASNRAVFGSQTINLTQSLNSGLLAAFSDPTVLGTTPGAAAGHFSLFPNPAHTTVVVPLPAASMVFLTLLDALGRVVRTQVASPAPGAREAKLDVADLAPGTYVLRTVVGDYITSSRLIIE